MAEANENAKFSVAKLNDQNYQPWKFKVKMLLIREGRWTMISEPKPDPVTQEWTEKDYKAQSTISLSIEDSQIVHVCKCTSAKAMWEELQKVHERANLSNKLYLLRKLYQSKLANGQDMQDYIRATLELVERLRGIGEEVREFHVAALLLGGLPENYETLVTALDARPDDELTLEYVKGKLVDEFKRKSPANTNEVKVSESALKVLKGSKKNEASHYVDRETRTCFVCKKPGHIKKDCRIWKARMKELDIKDQKAKTAVYKSKEVRISDDEACFKVNSLSNKGEGWYIDSGATSHMTNDKNFFTDNYTEVNEKVTVANGQQMTAIGVGDGFLKTKISTDKTRKIRVQNVLYVPELDNPLLSVKKLCQLGHTVEFKENRCTIKDKNSVLGTGRIENNLFRISCVESTNIVKQVNHNDCLHLWHRRLGHRSPQAVKDLYRKRLADGIKISDCNEIMKCISCIKGKLTEKSFPKKSNSRTNKPLELIHTDVCGPMKTETPGRKNIFLHLRTIFQDLQLFILCKQKTKSQ